MNLNIKRDWSGIVFIFNEVTIATKKSGIFLNNNSDAFVVCLMANSNKFLLV